MEDLARIADEPEPRNDAAHIKPDGAGRPASCADLRPRGPVVYPGGARGGATWPKASMKSFAGIPTRALCR